MSIVIDGAKRYTHSRTDGRPDPLGSGDARLIVVSNRLPVRIEGDGERPTVVRADGGLVTALGPLVQARGGVWIGWHGVAMPNRVGIPAEHMPPLAEFSRAAGLTLRGVPLTREDIDDYYTGFCNRTLWPLFHGFAPSRPLSDRQWRAYRRVNERFTNIIAEEVLPSDHILVNDYHLLLIPGLLRAQGIGNPLSCFMHTPFPPGELFSRLPWAGVLEESLLQADRLGFQTARDHQNFLDVVGSRVSGRNESGVFPISVDVDEFASVAKRPEVLERADAIREEVGVPHLLLGVDRLDYTKGLLEKLGGFEALLAGHEVLHGELCLTQLVVPSRTSVPEYRTLRERLERKVGRINGRFSSGGWIPIHYRYGRWAREELVAQYLAADVALVTPLRDGMNLVAKEFCVSQSDDQPGVLVLSEFAGAARELEEALLVNPHDARAVARAIRCAIRMPLDERRRRISSMVATVRKSDVYAWSRTFLFQSSPVSQRRTAMRPGDVRSSCSAARPETRKGCDVPRRA